MSRLAIVENDEIINVVEAPDGWQDPDGRETILAPLDGDHEIGCKRDKNNEFCAPKVDPATSEEREKNGVRKRRDALLADSDWTQVPDAPVDQQAWAVYRQALRDVPQQAGFPTDIDWPVKPE